MRRVALSLVLLTAVSGAAMAQDKPNFLTSHDSDVMTSSLIGLDVYNRGGEDVGEIKDLIIDDKTTVRGVIVSVGGFLGMGEHYVAIDPSALDVKHDDAKNEWRATLDTTKDQLKAAPQFEYKAKQKD
ncbi:PRC-barrel domain-containing protein [Inquilinus sp.]|jgi:sporulation protein YlmC with PRC-barrel domain|uniref:PRC-barrel domain-containing protein n=1 Tax=Inquilinus sp. TaxID=1932117 RepID=UPI003783EBE1